MTLELVEAAVNYHTNGERMQTCLRMTTTRSNWVKKCKESQNGDLRVSVYKKKDNNIKIKQHVSHLLTY